MTSQSNSCRTFRINTAILTRDCIPRFQLLPVEDARMPLVACLVAVVMLTVGCSSHPSAITPPNINAAAAATAAFKLYDTNNDGFLSNQELDAIPGVKASLQVYDIDHDGKVSVEEMRERIGAWKKTSPGMMSWDCYVTIDGKPLEGAEVVYNPEPYVADWLHPSSDVTGPDGIASIAIPAEYLAKDHQRIRAVNAGVYKVQITHPKLKIPARYNEKTTLGRELSRETKPGTFDTFQLSSR
jgi:hypothetical protein